MSDLILKMAPGPEDESPYEALCEATSCHSLDSLTSGKSSDRDSGRPDSEASKVSLLTHCHNPERPLEGGSGPRTSSHWSWMLFPFCHVCTQELTHVALLLTLSRRIEDSIPCTPVLLMKRR